MIRQCEESDIDEIYGIINSAAQAYKGVIPDDRWHEPYMSRSELRKEIADGVVFWGIIDDEQIIAVMGIQDRGEVALIRHAYVRTKRRKEGIGTRLLRHLEFITEKPILVGTWANARWAIDFYQRHGYSLLPEEKKTELLRIYWRIPERQVETSVVLAKNYFSNQQRHLYVN